METRNIDIYDASMVYEKTITVFGLRHREEPWFVTKYGGCYGTSIEEYLKVLSPNNAFTSGLVDAVEAALAEKYNLYLLVSASTRYNDHSVYGWVRDTPEIYF